MVRDKIDRILKMIIKIANLYEKTICKALKFAK